jgi:(p)ppGpp synthase/HD superfamily hydrolase
MKNNCSDKVIVSGILHDIVEDTDVTIDQISTLFGNEVADIVSKLSEDKSKTWEERKQYSIDKLKFESEEVMFVRCADALANVRDIVLYLDLSGEDTWKLFKRGKDKQEWYYRGLLDSLIAIKNYQIYKDYKKIINEIF